MSIGIIGGTGIDEMSELALGSKIACNTAYGSAELVEVEMGGKSVCVLLRHGAVHGIPPSQINYRANAAALKQAGVERVIAICAAGSLRADAPPGSFAVLGDFLDFTKRRIDTFHEDSVVHTDFSQAYCPVVSEALAGACAAVGAVCLRDAVYACTEGPRYETPAEIRAYRSLGADVIGMTGVPEVVLARELGMCYGSLAVVTNFAAGISPTPLSHDEVREAMKTSEQALRQVIESAIRLLPDTKACVCGGSLG